MKLIKYISIVILFSIGIAALSSWVIKHGLKKSSVDFYGKMNNAGNANNNTNFLLVGSSRTLVQFNPLIFDTVCKVNSYNYGLNASGIKTCYNIIQNALANQKNIKAIIINIDYFMFNINEDPYKDAYYYPYEKQIDNLLMTDSGSKKLIHSMKFLDIALFDDKIKYAGVDGILHPNKKISQLYKGFLPSTEILDTNAIDKTSIKPQEAIIHKDGLQVLTNIVFACKQKRIKLFLTISPYYKPYLPNKYITNYETIVSNVKKIAVDSNATFIDFSITSFSEDAQLFKNINHLNAEGANLYSLLLANYIKEQL